MTPITAVPTRRASRPESSLLADVPAPCPPWCQVAAHQETLTEDVVHEGPVVPTLVVPLDDGLDTPGTARLIGARILADATAAGGVARPVAQVIPDSPATEIAEMDATTLRQLVQQLRAHADALASLSDELEALGG